MQKSLGQILDNSQKNNFNSIRLCMALGVIYNHSFVLFQENGGRDVTTYLFGFFDAGSLSVSVFFLVSGMLLTQSFFKTQSRLKFILKRLLRIFPGLLICLLFTVFIIGTLNTTLSLKQYLFDRGTYRYLYNIFLNNETFFFNLPGCFTTNKLPEVVNGSLWTLPFELICYIFLYLILSGLGFFNSTKYSIFNKIFILLLLLFFGSYLLNGTYLLTRFKGLVTGYRVNLSVGNNSLMLFVFFAIGMIFYWLKEKIRLNIFYWIGLCGLLAVLHFLHMPFIQRIVEVIVIAYGVIVWAGSRTLHRFNFKTDPSYGIYLYAWPVQQTFAHYFHLDAYVSLLFTVPVVVLLGWLSYLIIEKPAMNSANPIYNRWLKKEIAK